MALLLNIPPSYGNKSLDQIELSDYLAIARQTTISGLFSFPRVLGVPIKSNIFTFFNKNNFSDSANRIRRRLLLYLAGSLTANHGHPTSD